MKTTTLKTLAALTCLALLAAACGEDSDAPVLSDNDDQHNQATGADNSGEPNSQQPGEENSQQPGDEENGDAPLLVPEFFDVSDGELSTEVEPELTVIADASDNINAPNDLAFHPFEDRSDELWILNEDSTTTGGSTVTLFGAGTADQDAEWIRDGNAWHFMALPTAIAFGDNGHWATGAGVQDSNHQGGAYSGPSLWSSDLEIYGVVGDPPTQEVNGSHLDMLHGSPYSMGIAYEHVPDNEWDNAFWVFDGYHGYPVRYDFHEPHYPGGYDHSNGRIHRYDEIELERHPGLPSHMMIDQETGWLYINDTGNQRVLRLNTATGEMKTNLGITNEPIAQHWEMHQVEWEVFIDQGLDSPSGMALNDGRLFVTDPGTGDLIAYDLETGEELDRVHVGTGIRGITIGPDAKLWLADYDNNRVLRVDPQ